MRRQPGGGFTKEAGPAIANGANYGAIGDFNGDALPDVAISSFPGEASNVLLNQPGGSFAHGLGSPIAMSHRAASIATADFDGDSDLDLAVGNWDGAQLSIRLRVVGGFVPGTPASTGVTPRHIIAGDFNGDGDPDLAVSNFNDGTVSILLGAAGDTFTPAPGSPVTIGTNAGAAVATDFSGDGRPDLAVLDIANDRVALLVGQSNGGFVPSPSAPVGVGDGPVGIAAGDFDLDGLSDLAVANNFAGTVSILLRQGAGFVAQPPLPIQENAGAYGVAVADFNADSRADLAVTNDQRGRLTILLNDTPLQTGPPPPAPNLDARRRRRAAAGRLRRHERGHPAGREGQARRQGRSGLQRPRCALPLLDRRVEAFLHHVPEDRYTVFTSLTVKPVRRGDTLRLTCQGPGCPLKGKTIRVKKSAHAAFAAQARAGAKLRKGARVQLRITRPATIGRVTKWTIRAPKTAKITRHLRQAGREEAPAAARLIGQQRGELVRLGDRALGM